MMGSPETLRNLERKSWKTVFLGSQDFELRTDAGVLLTGAFRHAGRRYPQYSQVFSDWRVSPVSRHNRGGSQVNASR
jgi:hypothetical protein